MTGHIFFRGDPLGRFDHIAEAVLAHRPEAVVLLGDIQAQRPLQIELADILSITEVWWIAGNHDSDSIEDYDNLFGSTLADRNLHGRVAEVAGMRIAGLSGIFRGQVWKPPYLPAWETRADYCRQMGKGNLWRGGLGLKHRSTIFPEDLRRLASMRADVLVTHEAPSVHPHGFAVIDELARSMGVQRTYHGHHHDALDYSQATAGLGFKAHGVGLRGIIDLKGNVIRAGECDEARGARRWARLTHLGEHT